ncbi:YdaU family protein [Polaromonas sp.]|uniref:YdaU family protein n=1 Tax=Polaromonas sp. TaxID=1869339 RepID=UPI003752B556
MSEEVQKVDAWMPLWIGAYLADTTHLSRDQHGGYLLLLIAYWRNRGPLIDQGERLSNICKATPAEWRRLRPLLVEFFEERDGTWVHGRADKELAAAGLRKAAATSKAKAAAEARWGKTSEHPRGSAPSMPQALPKDMLKDCPTPSPTELRSEKPTADAVVKKRRTTFPVEFAPNEAGLSAAIGLPLAQELEAFRNHHTAKGSLMLDWQAAWRTWAGNARKFGKPAAPSGEPGWRRDARERMQAAVPGIAEKSGTPAHEFFELEAKNVSTPALGR